MDVDFKSFVPEDDSVDFVVTEGGNYVDEYIFNYISDEMVPKGVRPEYPPVRELPSDI